MSADGALPITAVPCPPWCTVDHSDMPPGAGFHGSALRSTEMMPCPVTFRLWQTDHEGAAQGIIFAGQFLTGGQAHDIGLELVRAADVLRREGAAGQ